MQSTPRLRLEPITWRNFTICGSSETPPENGTPSGSAADAGQGNGSAETDEIKDPVAKILSLTEEKDRHFRARQEAERKLNERLAEDRKAEEAQLGEVEKTKRQLDETSTRAQQLEATNRRLALDNAFLMANETQWHNPAAARRLVDLSEVELDDDGSVKNPDALKAAIKKLAKDEPYLVKAATKEEQPPQPPPSSGQAPQGGQQTGQNGIDRTALLQKYPALRQH